MEDLQLARALWGDERVTSLIGGPFDEQKISARLASEVAMESAHGVQYWPIFLHDGAHAGCCGLRTREVERDIYEIGFHLRPDHWGKGLAVEGGRSVLRHAFHRLQAQGIFAGHHPDNAASCRALQKLGLRYTHDELYPPTGRMHRGYLLTREEFLRAQ